MKNTLNSSFLQIHLKSIDNTIVKIYKKISLEQIYSRSDVFFFIWRIFIHKAVKNDYNSNVSDLLNGSYEQKP